MSYLEVILWTRLALQRPTRSGRYRIRNRDCKEGVAEFVTSQDSPDGQSGWIAPGWHGDIDDWMEMAS